MKSSIELRSWWSSDWWRGAKSRALVVGWHVRVTLISTMFTSRYCPLGIIGRVLYTTRAVKAFSAASSVVPLSR